MDKSLYWLENLTYNHLGASTQAEMEVLKQPSQVPQILSFFEESPRKESYYQFA